MPAIPEPKEKYNKAYIRQLNRRVEKANKKYAPKKSKPKPKTTYTVNPSTGGIVVPGTKQPRQPSDAEIARIQSTARYYQKNPNAEGAAEFYRKHPSAPGSPERAPRGRVVPKPTPGPETVRPPGFGAPQNSGGYGGRPSTDRPEKYNANIPYGGAGGLAGGGGLGTGGNIWDALGVDPVDFGLTPPPLDVTQAQLDQYRKRAAAAAGIQYDPMINELAREQDLARKSYTRNDKTIKDMYAALGASIGQDAMALQGIANQSVAGSNAATQNLVKSMQTQYEKSLGQQTKENAALGITDVNSQAFAPMQDTNTLLQGIANVGGQANTAALQAVGQGGQNAMAELKAMSGAQGNISRTDLMNQLNDLLYRTTGKITDLRGAKGAATNELAQQYGENYLDRAFRRYSLEEGTARDQYNARIAEGNLALGLGQLQNQAAGLGSQGSQGSDNVTADAYSQLDSYMANTLWPDNPEGAKNAQGLVSALDAFVNANPYSQYTGAGKYTQYSEAELRQKAHELNSKENAKKGGYKQVDTEKIDRLVHEWYMRIFAPRSTIPGGTTTYNSITQNPAPITQAPLIP